MNRSEQQLGQPRATWGNLKTEVAPLQVILNEGLVKLWGNRGDLFESLTCGEKEMVFVSGYRMSWQKVAPVAPAGRNVLVRRRLMRGNLKGEVAPGCPGR